MLSIYSFNNIETKNILSHEAISNSNIKINYSDGWERKLFNNDINKLSNYSSNFNSYFEIDNSSYLTTKVFYYNTKIILKKEMINKKNFDILEKISEIYEKVVYNHPELKEIDKKEFIKYVSELIKNIASEKLNISEGELYNRVRLMMAILSISNILNDLTPVQKKIFLKEVKRRPFFK